MLAKNVDVTPTALHAVEFKTEFFPLNKYQILVMVLKMKIPECRHYS